MSEQIYIQLLNEGTTVYRAVSATKVCNNIYVIDDSEIYDPEDEEWEFLPEEKVQVAEKELEGEKVLVAIKKALIV